VRKLYTEALIGRGDITVEDAEQALRDYQEQLERVFAETREATRQPVVSGDVTAGLDLPLAQQESGTSAPPPTAVDLAVLKRIGDAHVSPPSGSRESAAAGRRAAAHPARVPAGRTARWLPGSGP